MRRNCEVAIYNITCMFDCLLVYQLAFLYHYLHVLSIRRSVYLSVSLTIRLSVLVGFVCLHACWFARRYVRLSALL